MSFEQRDQSGVLFRNDRKANDRAPDYKGKCKVNGVDMEMAAWLKEGKNGKFMSFAFSEPYEKPAQSGNDRTQSGNDQSGPTLPAEDGFDEDRIPFDLHERGWLA